MTLCWRTLPNNNQVAVTPKCKEAASRYEHAPNLPNSQVVTGLPRQYHNAKRFVFICGVGADRNLDRITMLYISTLAATAHLKSRAPYIVQGTR